MTFLIEGLAEGRVSRDRDGALKLAKNSYLAEYQRIMDATGGVGELSPDEAIKRLEEIREKYGPLGVYLAVYQAVGFPESYSDDACQFDKSIQVQLDTLGLAKDKRAYSFPRVLGVADVSDSGREVRKTAKIGLSEDGKQIIFVNPQHETDNYSGKDRFEDWGAGWITLLDGTASFTPTNIGHILSGRFNPYRDMLILEEDVLFSNPNAKEFSRFRVPVTFISLYSNTPIGDTEAPRFQRILQL